jgi:hypothetical protein
MKLWRQKRPPDRLDDARRYRVAVFVLPDVDRDKATHDLQTDGSVFRRLARRDGGVALDADLDIGSAEQRGMAARALAVVPATRLG